MQAISSRKRNQRSCGKVVMKVALVSWREASKQYWKLVQILIQFVQDSSSKDTTKTLAVRSHQCCFPIQKKLSAELWSIKLTACLPLRGSNFEAHLLASSRKKVFVDSILKYTKCKILPKSISSRPIRLFVFMVALCNRADHYIFILFLSSFFARLISAVGNWMFTILWHMMWP